MTSRARSTTARRSIRYVDYDTGQIYYKPLYYQLANNVRLLKKVIIEIAKVLMLLSETQIVHSDLKT